MVEVEDGGPAGWVGTGAGLQGLPAPNADLDTATEPRYMLRPLWLLSAPPHAATQHTCAVAPRARHMPGLQGARPLRWRPNSRLRSHCAYPDPTPQENPCGSRQSLGTMASVLRLRTPRPRGRGPLAKGTQTEGGGFKISFQNRPALPTSLVLFEL